MKLNILLIAILIFGLNFSQILAQEEIPSEPIESIEEEEEGGEEEDVWDDDMWEDSFEMEDIEGDDFFSSFMKKENVLEEGVPMIRLTYGLSTPSFADSKFLGSLSEMRSTQVMLGDIDIYSLKNTEYVFEYHNDFIFINNVNDLFFDTETTADVLANSWSFGLGQENGYGYRLGKKNGLIFTHSTSILWNSFDFRNQEQGRNVPDTIQNPYNIHKFGERIRFGGSYEAGVKLRLFKHVSLDAGYEQMAIFPAHMFWYWAGSEIIFNAGHYFIDEFVEEIAERSPYAAPIVYAILKAGISYGFYELRKDNMNWPIQTAEPFIYDNIKFGMSFYF